MRPYHMKAYRWLKVGAVILFFGYGLYAFLKPSNLFMLLAITIIAFVAGYFSIR